MYFKVENLRLVNQHEFKPGLHSVTLESLANSNYTSVNISGLQSFIPINLTDTGYTLAMYDEGVLSNGMLSIVAYIKDISFIREEDSIPKLINLVLRVNSNKDSYILIEIGGLEFNMDFANWVNSLITSNKPMYLTLSM